MIVLIVRKRAHLTEYAVLGWLLWRALRKPVRRDPRPWSWIEVRRVLLIVMFVLAVTGTLTILGAFAFLEYALSLLYVLTVGVLIAFALLAAIALCSLAFRETTEQAVLLRNVTVLSTFAWIGLAFIAAYHIVWVVFILTLISLWPLRATSAK